MLFFFRHICLLQVRNHDCSGRGRRSAAFGGSARVVLGKEVLMSKLAGQLVPRELAGFWKRLCVVVGTRRE